MRTQNEAGLHNWSSQHGEIFALLLWILRFHKQFLFVSFREQVVPEYNLNILYYLTQHFILILWDDFL